MKSKKIVFESPTILLYYLLYTEALPVKRSYDLIRISIAPTSPCSFTMQMVQNSCKPTRRG